MTRLDLCLLQLEEVYAEIGRVLKPGKLFASYEWVATKKFDPNNKEHVKIIDEINFGNGLPVRPVLIVEFADYRCLSLPPPPVALPLRE